jgi:hypothetical protein
MVAGFGFEEEKMKSGFDLRIRGRWSWCSVNKFFAFGQRRSVANMNRRRWLRFAAIADKGASRDTLLHPNTDQETQDQNQNEFGKHTCAEEQPADKQ